MTDERREGNLSKTWTAICGRISGGLDIPRDIHSTIYGGVMEDADWRKPYYWICLLSSCGIATLGLAQNSPAVIIGAMLLSPLMSPIVGLGLALAAGDLFLGLRSFINCLISTVTVVGVAALITVALPFKETTAEILARTRPNPLDLFIALFCGLVAAVSVARSYKAGPGMALPGAAIAVALVPPLCVAGWGLGAGFQGAIFRGAMVLFLTNLTAIVFLSLLVFLALGIGNPADAPAIRGVLEKFETEGPLKTWVQSHPWMERFRRVGGVRSRILIVAVGVALLYIPLDSGLRQVKRELFVNGEVKKAISTYLEAYTILSRKVTTTPDGAVINLTLVSDQDPPARALASLETYLKGRLGPGVTIEYTEVAKGTYAADRIPGESLSPQQALRQFISQVQSRSLSDLRPLWPERAGFPLADLSLVVPLGGAPPRIRVRYVADEAVPPAVLETYRLSVLRASGIGALGIEGERIPRTWGELDLLRSSRPGVLRAWSEQVRGRSVPLPQGLRLEAVLRRPEGVSPERLRRIENLATEALKSLAGEPWAASLPLPDGVATAPASGGATFILTIGVESPAGPIIEPRP